MNVALAPNQVAEARKRDAEIVGNRRTYFRDVLKIRTKSGQIVPFKMNRAQLYTDKLLDQQGQQTGRVRALVLKGRQLGISTYIQGRFYHRAAGIGGCSAFVLSHKEDSTSHIFSMSKRFWQFAPAEFRPRVGRSNKHEIMFPYLGSDYAVATAGGKESGRSRTVQLFHGSEVAFWQNAGDHAMGAMQSVANDDGTEIILESTANGMGNYFYDLWQKAEKGEGDFIAIFIPWYWGDEYRREPPDDFVLTDEEFELQSLYKLDDAQIYWRRKKIEELNDEWRFKQEYPMNAQEAFQMSGHSTLIKSEIVVRARNTKLEDDPDAPLTMGVDCARNTGTGDRTKLVSRKGRRIGKHVNITLATDDTMHIVGVVAKAIVEHKIQMTFIDAGGNGAAIYDRLVERGFGERITLVNFGSQAEAPRKYANARAEMWDRFAEWLKDPGGAEVPDDNTFHRHACSALFKYDSNSRLQLERKEKIKKEFGFSPDEGDAAALTFRHAVVAATSSNNSLTARFRRRRQHRTWMGA